MNVDITICIDMRHFGLSFNVPTDIEQINELLEKFNTEPDEYFGGGRGKQWVLAQLDYMLSTEDDYFAEDILRQAEEPERWNAFLTSCVAYACLSCHIADSALPLELN
jgi:hypothetical protein